MAMRAYGMILDHVLIILALYPFQHLTHTYGCERMVLIHHGVGLQCLVPQTILAESIIEVGLLSKLFKVEL